MASPAAAGLIVPALLLSEAGDRLGYGGAVDVLGLSWGGGLAQQLAVQSPRKVHRVVLVATDEDVPEETVEEVTALVGQAGGTVTGTIRLQPGYSDPATAAEVQSYVTGPGLPTGVTLPETDDTGQLVGALLAQVLMRPATRSSRSSTGPSRSPSRWRW